MKYLSRKVGKRIVVFLFALSLFFSGWGNYDLSVVQAEGELTVALYLDKAAPELTAYSVSGASGNTPHQSGAGQNMDVYKNAPASPDVTIAFTIEDDPAYWNPSNVKFEIWNTGTGTQVSADRYHCEWSDEGSSSHTLACTFDGEEDPAPYQVKIFYADMAGNKLVAGTGVNAGTILDGLFTSEKFILDHKAPVFGITYNAAYRLVKNSGPAAQKAENDKKDAVPEHGYTAYYNSAITAAITIEEDYAVENGAGGIFSGLSDGGDEDLKIQYTDQSAQSAQSPVTPTVTWTKSGGTYTGTFTIDREGDYIVTVSYRDAAHNAMVADTANVQGCKDALTQEGFTYTSEVLVLDQTPPALTASFSETPVLTVDERQYFNSAVKLNVELKDAHARSDELREILLAMKVKKAANEDGGDPALIQTGKEDEYVLGLETGVISSNTKNIKWEIPLSKDGNYDISEQGIEYEDLAGNKTAFAPMKACVDVSDMPEVEISYVKREATFIEKVNYLLNGYWFANGSVDVHAEAADSCAGTKWIQLVIEEDGKEPVTVEKTASFPYGKISCEYTIPSSSADFKGTLKASAKDWLDREAETIKSGVVESGGKHGEAGNAKITTLTSPSRSTGGKNFYNTDVQFNLLLEDAYSGLSKFEYKIGNAEIVRQDYVSGGDKESGAGTDFNETPTKEITYKWNEDLRIDASSNNQNDIKVSADYTDNAGHTGHVEEIYNIDTTAPTIEVEYDLNSPSNEHFYNKTRTATVTVVERNFDENDVVFHVTNTDGTTPAFGSWSSSGTGDETRNVCTVTFSADGDYTFTLEFQDMAGNKADYSRVDEFTIDQTAPDYTVTYNNNQSINESYYAENRTAIIDVLEHNFDPSLVQVLTTQDGGAGPSVSGWSRNGDHNVATVAFHSDGDFTFDIEGMDQADNPLKDYEPDSFTVDTTVPEMEIFDIEDMSANNDVVAPGIRFSDTNYDADGTVILLKGYHNGEQEITGSRRVSGGGVEIKMADFERVPSMDDLYTLEATVHDLAGNSSEASVTFSVNRFGSVYTFDEATEKLIGGSGSYYTNKEQELIITETNVDTLEFREITCNLNGDLKTLEEGKNYSVSKSGDELSWKQYTYRIGKENFADEGAYVLTIYSEDRASNTSDNNSKGRKIEFVVDKTEPSILISGVENNGQYRENSREITLDVQDNVLLSEVEVVLNGKKKSYDAAQLAEADGKLSFVAGSANHWQTIQVSAYDAAGNEQAGEELRFLVTANVLVQLYMDTPVFAGTMAGGTAAAAGAWWMLFKRKRFFRK